MANERKTVIVTDSSCDLSDEQLQRYGIRMISLRVVCQNAEYRDRVDITEEELYAKGGEILMEVTKATEPHESDVVIDYAKDDEGTWEAAEDAEMAIMDAML